MSLDDKKGGLRKEFTYNRRKKDGEEGPPQAPLYLCSERKRVEFLFKLD
mgnify:CR=1 FL=1